MPGSLLDGFDLVVVFGGDHNFEGSWPQSAARRASVKSGEFGLLISAIAVTASVRGAFSAPLHSSSSS